MATFEAIGGYFKPLSHGQEIEVNKNNLIDRPKCFVVGKKCSMAGWNGFNNAADIGRLPCVASSIPYGKCGCMAMAGHGNGEVKGSFHAKKKERTFGRFSSDR